MLGSILNINSKVKKAKRSFGLLAVMVLFSVGCGDLTTGSGTLDSSTDSLYEPDSFEHSTEGTTGSPTLEVISDMCAGCQYTINMQASLTQAVNLKLVIGSQLNPTPFMGGALGPVPQYVQDHTTNAQGLKSVTGTLDANLPVGTEFFLQFWHLDPGGVQSSAGNLYLRGRLMDGLFQMFAMVCDKLLSSWEHYI